MGQDAPRKKVEPNDGLLDFGSEAPDPALDKKEWDVAFRDKEPDSAFGRKDPEIVFNRQEGDITSGTGNLDIQPDAHVLPLDAGSLHPFVWHTSVPVGHKSARLKIAIALLVLGGIGALAWPGRLLMGMRRDAGTSGAQIQSASQPTPTVPLEAPTNVLPPAPDPQPRATDVPAETATPSKPATAIATPSEAPANAPDVPRAERPARQAEPPPVKADPNAAGGLFAITRPVERRYPGQQADWYHAVIHVSAVVRLARGSTRAARIQNVLVVDPSRTKHAIPSCGSTRRDSLSSRHVW